MGFPGGTSGKKKKSLLPMQVDIRDLPGLYPWVGKIQWRREWQPTLVFLPGDSHGQRSLVGLSPWGGTAGQFKSLFYLNVTV